MEIQFLGGAKEVGRSSFYLKGSKNFLLDYGVKVGRKIEYPISAGKVDAFILSHAHLDHCGFAPELYKHAFPIAFGTEPSLKLAELLLEDSIKIGIKEHLPPKFTKRELGFFTRRYVPYEYGSSLGFGEYDISFYDAGHMCGSAVTKIEKSSSGRKLVYTGDFKLEEQLLQKSAEIVDSDILIIETTYANRNHEDRSSQIKDFIEKVREVIDNKGTALVPVFAVGRAQEVLAMLHKGGLSDKVYMDGMARKATEITMDFSNYLNNLELLRGAIKRIQTIRERRERIGALEGGNIILTPAGMLNGGPVLNYITKLRKNSKIFLTGYQAEGTNGRRVLEEGKVEVDERIHRIPYPVLRYDFSAHAGRDDILTYIRKSNPEKIVCVHGDAENATALAVELKEEGFEAFAPEVGDRLEFEF